MLFANVGSGLGLHDDDNNDDDTAETQNQHSSTGFRTATTTEVTVLW